MNVSSLVWWATIAAIVALLAFDFFFHVRKAHVPSLREASVWSALYVGLAVLFGVGLWLFGGAEMGGEYFAGYVTEKALSVDNLFVFLIIMAGFKVPRADQQKVLLFGIVFSLVARAGFIAARRRADQHLRLGLLPVRRCSCCSPPGTCCRPAERDDARSGDNVMVRLAPPTVPRHRRLRRRQALHRAERQARLTPMLLVMVAIGGTDILFALDSIPAIFGLTQNVVHRLHRHRVLADGSAPALLPHRRLLDRLIYLPTGWPRSWRSSASSWSCTRCTRTTCRSSTAASPCQVVEISTSLSLTVIIGVLVVTVSPRSSAPRGRRRTPSPPRAVTPPSTWSSRADPARREEIYRRLLAEIDIIKALPEKYRKRIREEDKSWASSLVHTKNTSVPTPQPDEPPDAHCCTCPWIRIIRTASS